MLPLRKKVKPCRTWLLIFFFSILVFVFVHLSSWFRTPSTVFYSPEPFQLLVLIIIFVTVWRYIWSIFYSTRQVSFLSFFIVVSISSFLPDRYGVAHVIWKCKQTESGYTAEILPHLLLSMHFATMFNPKSLPR